MIFERPMSPLMSWSRDPEEDVNHRLIPFNFIFRSLNIRRSFRQNQLVH